MSISAKVLLDSIHVRNGHRLTTLEVTFPRFILAEFNTHRSFSRNSASSRAIPTAKLLQRVQDDPAIPVEWGANQSGMSAENQISNHDQETAQRLWLAARENAVDAATMLNALGVHKQVTNRVLEPFMWHTVIVSATEWENFFHLRLAKNAQPEMRATAEAMLEAINGSKPQTLSIGEWHAPLIQDDERKLLGNSELLRISVARCARVSYLQHDGTRDVMKDIDLYERLRGDGHLTPFEHVAVASSDDGRHANFYGWRQLRESIETEQCSQSRPRYVRPV